MNRFPPYLGAPGGIRTHNLLIRSQALYPLSYGGSVIGLYPIGQPLALA